LHRAQKQRGTRTTTETIHKALDPTASEPELVKALNNLLDKGKSYISDAFGKGS